MGFKIGIFYINLHFSVLEGTAFEDIFCDIAGMEWLRQGPQLWLLRQCQAFVTEPVITPLMLSYLYSIIIIH